ncbi:telomere repeat binding factor-domain-containing protein, partial [Peziza echinospora]
MDDSTAVLWSANHGMRVRSLPVVDNLSTQILLTLGKGPYQETLNIVTCPESDSGQAYSLLKSLFDQTKKIYTQEAFLSAEELKLDTPEQRSIIRKVNLATFVSSVFGSQEVGFFHLNECFLDTFVPDGGRLLKSQGALYLDLKTQAYISALSTGERDKVDILNDLFPDDIHHHLLVRRPGAKGLTPSEADFVQRAHQRKQHLIQLPEDAQLSDKYVWQDFLQDVSSYVSKHYEQIMTQPVRKNRKRQYSHNGGPRAATAAYSRTDHTAHNQQYSVLQHQPVHMQLHTQPVEQHQPQPMYHQQPEYELPAQPQPTADDADAATAAALSAHNAAHTAAQHHLQHHQEITTPTQVLYERARLAAQSKASPNARRSGLPSQRRPWTPEEETALMAGLDRVKGPHWSQILAMFGPGGTINEVLKDRNQVQLKDKARNLKLFFLKSGIEVPYYLQFVTGELK